MQAPIQRPTRRSALRQLAALFAVACVLPACDRHSAQEVPESYGHGSARPDAGHTESYTDHQVDSSGDKHFSDTQGTEEEPAATPDVAPLPTPAGTPTGHFF